MRLGVRRGQADVFAGGARDVRLGAVQALRRELELLERRARRHSHCVLVQTVARLDGDFDAEGIRAAEALHKRRFDTLARQVKLATGGECMPMGAGSCTRCAKCTYPDRPCRYPDKLWPSMEAYGLLVSDACRSAGLEYYHGPGTIPYSSCILIN